jgi:imidazolonepropionase-like amidohydrolase
MFQLKHVLPLVLALAGCKPSEETRLKAIVGAVLIDGEGGPPVSDSVLVVAGSRVRASGPRANVPIPAGAEKVNGAGKFLLPGLIDLHVHVGRRGGPKYIPSDYTRDRIEKNLNTYLYFGVTTVRSVGADLDAAFAVRQAERGGALLTARLFTAGRGFTAPGGHPSQELGDIARQTDDPEEARRQVAELARQRVDAIKIWVDDLRGKKPKIKPAVMEAILEEARKYNIPVVAHIYSLADTKFLVNNGVAGFLHMIRDTEEIDPSFVSRLRDLQLVFAPTLIRQELGWFFKQHPEWLNDPDVERSVDRDAIAAAKAQAGMVPPPDFEVAKRNARRLAATGVPIGVGSDGGSSLDFPGLMTHREMELLVESGLSTMAVIVAATRNGALALRKLDEFGTLTPGKRADLLLIVGNPIEDIRNLRKIDRVMLDGQWIDRAGLKLR